MNYSIGIALLLLFASAQFVTDEQINSWRISKVNERRLKLALEKKIANMHDVTWDHTLESKIEKLTCDKWTTPGADYVVVSCDEATYRVRPNIIQSAIFDPLQTKYACGYLMPKCGRIFICLMGPKNSEAKKSNFKQGEPGTQCSSGSGTIGQLCTGDAESKEGEKAVSSASMPMAFLSLAIGLIMT